jgi:signal transduction histidine kinase
MPAPRRDEGSPRRIADAPFRMRSVGRVRQPVAPAFDTAGGQRLAEVLVNLLIVGFTILFTLGMVEALTLQRPWEWVQPGATAVLIMWALVMKRRSNPRPVPLLMVSSTLAAAYLVVAAATGSIADVTNTSPVVMVVGAGAIALAAGGSRPTRTAIYVGILSAISVVAVQTALNEHPMAIFVEVGSSVVVVGLAYYLVRSVRVAFETGSSRYSGLTETAPVAVVEADLSGIVRRRFDIPVIRHVNPRARDFLGVGDLEITAINASAVPEVFQDLINHVAHGSTAVGERVVSLEGGRALLVNWRVLDRRLERVIFTGVDITSQQKAERSLAEQVKARDQFIASVSHELRTPLTGTLGLLELVQSGDVADAAERDEFLTLALAQTRDMADIVQDLLVAARASSGGLVIKSESMPLAPLATEVAASVAGSFIIDELDAPHVIADPVRVRQIVRNLATNAVRYGGPVRTIRVTTLHGKGMIEVLDDGAPLDPEIRDRMFEAYERSGDANLPTESVGLGLTVARMLAHLMGGELTYHHDGTVSAFSLTLPLDSEIPVPVA